MAKTRSQVKKKRRRRSPEVNVLELQKNTAGCDHIEVEPIDGGHRVHGIGFAAFAWDAEQMADTPRFVCSTCEASTLLPGLIVKRGQHG